MPRSLAPFAAALLILAGCAHGKPAARAEEGIVVHGRIITEGPGQQPAASPTFAYWAVTPMAGKCTFSRCLEDGWVSATPEGNAATRCNRDCRKDGWTTEHPDGTRSETRCLFGKCFHDGWVTTHDDGNTVEVRCEFGDCLKNGWKATASSGETSDTACSFQDCAHQGWTTTAGDQTITCKCRFRDCAKDGADCD